MTIRPVTAADLPAVQAMAARFLSDDGPYGHRFSARPSCIAAIVAQMSAAGALGLVVEHDGALIGMFGAFCFDHPITGVRTAAELCWWVEPEHRGGRVALHLLRAGERWARAAGATCLELIAPTERVAQFYDRLGYDRTDVHYVKTL